MSFDKFFVTVAGDKGGKFFSQTEEDEARKYAQKTAMEKKGKRVLFFTVTNSVVVPEPMPVWASHVNGKSHAGEEI